MGLPGGGKTTALATIPAAGYHLFVLFVDVHGPHSLMKACKALGVDMSLVHWAMVRPAAPDISSLADGFRKANTMDQKTLQTMPPSNRQDYRQLDECYNLILEFIDQTGKNWGPVDNLPEDSVFVWDGLTGLNDMAIDGVVGSKMIKSPADWQIGQQVEYQFIRFLVGKLRCHFVLLAHVRKPYTETEAKRNISQGEVSVAALGSALGPTMPGIFGESILAYREGAKFYWSTMEDRSATKAGLLEMSSQLPADFGPLLAAHKELYTA